MLGEDVIKSTTASRTRRPFSTPRLLACLIGLSSTAALLPAGPSYAQTWIGDEDGLWDTSRLGFSGFTARYYTNWSPDGSSSVVLPSPTSTVYFGDSGLTTSVDLNGDRTVAEVNFSGSQSYTLSGNTLTVQNQIRSISTTTQYIDSHVQRVSGNLEVYISSSPLYLRGGATVFGNLNKTGPGNLYLSNPSSTTENVITGDLYVYGGDFYNDETLKVGDAAGNGPPNWLTISDATNNSGFGTGGRVYVSGGSSLINNRGAYLGDDAGEYGYATVTGNNSRWTNTNSLRVGNSGTGTLNVEAGGRLSNSTGFLGRNSGSTGTATVTGNSSTWSNSSSLYVGFLGAGTLNVEAGGRVFNTTGYLGSNSGSTGAATVTGSGSTWTNSSNLIVAQSGDATLNVEAGGYVSNTTGTIGYFGGTTGTATVTGNDSAWNNTVDLYVGRSGNGTLNIANNGNVYVGDAAQAGATTNGTFISNRTALIISDSTNTNGTGTGGHLYVKNSSTVSNGGNAYLGDQSGEYGYATVTGSGSTWTNTVDLYVGNSGTGTLNVEAGGAVSNADGYIGFGGSSMGTTTVTGSGSTWTNAISLTVGYTGTGTLNVEAGGSVSNGDAYLGRFSGSTGTVTVTGSGSIWTNNSDGFGTGQLGNLYVGQAGTGTLNVEAGGTVLSSGGHLGLGSGSTGTATVTGSGSVWSSSSLAVGGSGTGTLNVENGAQVRVWASLLMQGGGGTSYLNFILASTADPLIDVGGSASLAGELTVDLDPSLTLVNGDVFTLIDIGGGRSGVFSNYAQDDLLGTFNGIDLHLSYTGGDGNDVVAYAVPEPSSLAMLALGGLLLARRRRAA